VTASGILEEIPGPGSSDTHATFRVADWAWDEIHGDPSLLGLTRTDLSKLQK
jgi:hypothetical protein